MQSEQPATLTADEREELAGCEALIRNGFQSFVTVGRALATVRDKRLYRETHATFDRYCREKWQIQRAYAYRLLGAAAVVDRLSPIGDTAPSPQNESQVRPLIGLAPDQIQAAWKNAVAAAKGKGVTARLVAKAAEQFRPAEIKQADPRKAMTGRTPSPGEAEKLLSDALDLLDQLKPLVAAGPKGKTARALLKRVRLNIQRALGFLPTSPEAPSV